MRLTLFNQDIEFWVCEQMSVYMVLNSYLILIWSFHHAWLILSSAFFNQHN